MINRKYRLWIIILGFILISLILHLPARGFSILVKGFIRYKYGISVDWAGFRGGFVGGISLDKVRVVNRDYTVLSAQRISSDIRFRDFIFHRKDSLYHIALEEPVVSIKGPLEFRMGRDLWTKIQISVTKGAFLFQDSAGLIALGLDSLSGSITKIGESLVISFTDPEHVVAITGEIDLGSSSGTLEVFNGEINLPQLELPTIKVNGEVMLSPEGIKIEQGRFSLGELELEIEGIIFTNRQLDLAISVHTGETEEVARFSVRGSLDEPQISTNWGVIETIFRVGGVNYTDGRLVFHGVFGEIELPGFGPFELEGGLIVGVEGVIFKDITLAEIVNIDGEISRCRASRLKLWIKDTMGSVLADKLPEVLRPLISAHTVNARLLVYGDIDDLQGSGILRLFSYPIKIACRYRHNKFSFCSVGEEAPFRISGSINSGEESYIKVKGCFRRMAFVDLMALFTNNIDSDWQGVVDGEFKIAGGLDSPLIQAKLEIKDGQIGNVKFDVAYLNLEGTGARLDLKHSMVYYKEIPAELTGYINPGGKDLFSNINIIPTSDSFIWKGLNITRDVKEKSIIFGQDVSDTVSIELKAPVSSDPEYGGMDSEPEIKVEYRLREDKSILIKMEEDEGTVGIEHKVKF